MPIYLSDMPKKKRKASLWSRSWNVSLTNCKGGGPDFAMPQENEFYFRSHRSISRVDGNYPLNAADDLTFIAVSFC